VKQQDHCSYYQYSQADSCIATRACLEAWVLVSQFAELLLHW
jgi:hypothetical protein